MDWRPAGAPGFRVAPLLPFARAPEVNDLIQLIDSSWYGHDGDRSSAKSRTSTVTSRRHGGFTSPVRLSAASGGGGGGGGGSQATAHLGVLCNWHGVAAIAQPSQQEDAQECSVPADIGTWAARQRVFLSPALAAEPPASSKAEQVTTGLTRVDEQYAEATPAGDFIGLAPDKQSLTLPVDMASGEAGARHQAWRWRFSRKWQMEQVRQQTAVTPTKDDDDWASALDYVAAAATGGLNMQFGQRLSVDLSTSEMEPSLWQSGLLDSSVSANDSFSLHHAASLTTPNATRQIFNVVKKAEELVLHQQDIVREAEAKWTEAQQPWIGHSMPGVVIDRDGQYTFILAKIVGRCGRRQKLLLRGANALDKDAALKSLDEEIAQLAVQQGLPPPRAILLGSGLMQWSQRCVNVVAHDFVSTSDTLRSKHDFACVSGTLVQTCLPPRYTVLVNGERKWSAAVTIWR